MHGFKSAILAIFQFCQNGTFEPVHEIRNFFQPKAVFWSIMKMTIRKSIHNLSQGPPNPGFMQKKVQKGDFLKKDSQELKNLFCFRFLWISGRSGTLNCERVFFWLSKNLCKQCAEGQWTCTLDPLSICYARVCCNTTYYACMPLKSSLEGGHTWHIAWNLIRNSDH